MDGAVLSVPTSDDRTGKRPEPVQKMPTGGGVPDGPDRNPMQHNAAGIEPRPSRNGMWRVHHLWSEGCSLTESTTEGA